MRPEAIREEESLCHLHAALTAIESFFFFSFYTRKYITVWLLLFLFYSRLLLVIKKIRFLVQDCFCGDGFIMFMVLWHLKLPLKVSS